MYMGWMIGDRVYRRKGLVMHVGVIIGDGLVAHNSPDNNVEVISLEQFAQGEKLHRRSSGLVDKASMLKRLENIKRENKRYCAVNFNCEVFANRLLDGTDVSAQVTAVLTGGAIGLACKNKWLGVFGFGLLGLALCNSLRSYSEA